MRIVSGRWGGRALVAPKGETTRPTSDSAREAIFNVLIHGMGHEPRRVVDFFAGTGALAWEALSQGAEYAALFEADRAAGQALVRNADAFGLASSDYTHVKEARIESWSAALRREVERGGVFDTLFCDPPYGKSLVARALKALELAHSQSAIVAPNAVLVAETGFKEDLPKIVGWTLEKERRKGAAALLFYRRSE